MLAKVYTAGSMEHVDKDTMHGWRDHVRRQLDMAGIGVLDPTRRAPLHEQEPTYNTLKRIVAQDLLDIKQCDMVLADLRDSQDGKKWGTVMEVALAAVHYDKPVIVIVDEDQFKHPFIYTFATEVHLSVDDAVEAIIHYF